jgi:DNA-directed RNA polymerase beta' subunit
MSSFVPLSELYKVKFFVLDEEDNKIDSNVEVTNKELFRNNEPFKNGVYDARLGTTDNSYICQTCFHSKNECPGHCGKMVSPYPMLSPLFKREVLKWLKITCFNCGELLVKLGKKHANLPKYMRLGEAVKLSRSSTLRNIKCNHCNAIHPNVEKDPKDHLKINIRTGDVVERLYNNKIEEILSKISLESVELMGKSEETHPRRLILRTIRVPPVTIRPDIKKIKGGRSNNNDLTTILKNMASLMEKVPSVLTDEGIEKNIVNLENIEMHYFNLIRDTPAGNANRLQSNTGSTLMSATGRLAKKTGRIRKNILGKRTSHMVRSVISVDNIKMYEVGLPVSVCRQIQKVVVVTPWNKDRLMVNFLNKDKQYPGCSRVKKANGKVYNINAIDDSFQIEVGDEMEVDLEDGDTICMNRAPTLTYSSIGGHRIKVIHKGDTIRLSSNVTDRNYGGDFDGDAMMGILPQSTPSTVESWYLTGVPQWSISLKDGTPSVGIYHDGMIGAFEFTKHGVSFSKLNAMRMLSTVDRLTGRHAVEKDTYTNYELVSKLLPEINYRRKAGFVKPEYSDFIDYNEEDVELVIHRGRMVKGRMDKKSIGQGVDGSLFHSIYNEKGAEAAIDTVFNIQQMTNMFLMHSGSTISKSDIALSPDAMDKIQSQTAAILLEAKQITENLHAGKIVPPLGTSIKDFFEEQQLSVLNLGDEFLRPVFEDLDPEKNNLYKLIVSGSKGKPTNFLQIAASIGQASIGGERMHKLFDYERTCPYYPRFDESPQNRGFVCEPYTTGVDMVSFIFQAMEARYSIINKALSTSITGEQNRKSIKNLESLIIDNGRKVSSRGKIIQFMYGGDGVDVRNNESNHMESVNMSDQTLEQTFRLMLQDLPKAMQGKGMQEFLDKSYAQIVKDRDDYRAVFLKIEKQNIKNKMFDNVKKLPINPKRTLADTVFNNAAALGSDPYIPDVVRLEEITTKTCKDMEYIYYNAHMQQAGAETSAVVKSGVFLMHIATRTHWALKKLVAMKVTPDCLALASTKLCFMLSKSLIDYGMPIGIVTAQCISEPMTQYVLDSHHRTGASGTKTDFLGRMKEILGAKNTAKMKAPSMVIHLKSEIQADPFKTQQTANHIEMMSFKQFVDCYQIFFERYGDVTHPEYKHENTIIARWGKHNPLLKKPTDLVRWCIRLEISKEKLIEKNMKLETICYKLFETYPTLYINHSAENTSGPLILRIYMKASHFKKNAVVNTALIMEFVKSQLLTCVIRGVYGIYSTNINQTLARTRIAEDGSVEKYSKPVVWTDGTNMEAIFANPFVDPYNTHTDSIIETFEMLGVEAAGNAIVVQLSGMMPSASAQYYRVYADTMTSTGAVSSIDRQGIQARERDNPLLVMANSHPLQTLEEAAANGMSSRCDQTLSPALMVGGMPKQATNYNAIMVNEKFIQANARNVKQQLDDL